MLRKGILQADIDINYVISSSGEFTGAHTESIVRLAIYNAMQFDIVDKRPIDIKQEEADRLQICNKDFMLALVKAHETYFSRKNCNHD